MRKITDSFKYAFNGLFLLLKTERSFQIHVIILCLAIAMGFILQITKMEWISILVISSVVLGLEALNSALEKLCDLVEPNQHPVIKKVKDISAGGVLVAAIAAVVIGALIFLPRLKFLLDL